MGEVALSDQDIPADQLESLVGDDSALFTPSQLVGMVEQPSLGLPSPRSAVVEELLQPSLHKSWADSLEEEEEMDFLEQCSEVQSGQGSQSLLHTNVEVSQVDTSMDGVEQAPLQPEARVQDLAHEARHKACFQATQDCFFGSSTRPQILPNTTELESANTLRT